MESPWFFINALHSGRFFTVFSRVKWSFLMLAHQAVYVCNYCTCSCVILLVFAKKSDCSCWLFDIILSLSRGFMTFIDTNSITWPKIFQLTIIIISITNSACAPVFTLVFTVPCRLFEMDTLTGSCWRNLWYYWRSWKYLEVVRKGLLSPFKVVQFTDRGWV